jgi:hypothetical protein
VPYTRFRTPNCRLTYTLGKARQSDWGVVLMVRRRRRPRSRSAASVVNGLVAASPERTFKTLADARHCVSTPTTPVQAGMPRSLTDGRTWSSQSLNAAASQRPAALADAPPGARKAAIKQYSASPMGKTTARSASLLRTVRLTLSCSCAHSRFCWTLLAGRWKSQGSVAETPEPASGVEQKHA